ncbi:MAG: KpsF/GutQ family sugar-phosphate isomerase [Planctomycetales bacterium]|nr:KpsF/GutQ family sugar-phosphate isomerase [Planctomycetales bacterium]
MQRFSAPSLAASTAARQLRMAREVLQQEAEAILTTQAAIDDSFAEAIRLLVDCRGSVIVTGMGKAGLVGQKIAATLASTGTRSHFLHPAEALHGDLGRVTCDDVALVLSHSGTTEEILRLVPLLRSWGVPLVAITGGRTNPLADQADVVLPLSSSRLREAGPLGLAPTTSTTAMLAIGDALAIVASDVQGFRADDFARFHPGGSLGKQLARVEEVMRPLERCRLGNECEPVRTLIVKAGRPGRRTGAIMLTNRAGQLTGIFTDSDLARLFENLAEAAIEGPMSRVMTSAPTTVRVGTMLNDAIDIMARRQLSELPIIDDSGMPVGLLDITDVVGLLPDAGSDHNGTEFPGRWGSDTCSTAPFGGQTEDGQEQECSPAKVVPFSRTFKKESA